MNHNLQDILWALLALGLETNKENLLFAFNYFDGKDKGETNKVWNEILKFGKRQGISAILLDGLQKLINGGDLRVTTKPSKELMMKYVSDCLRLERMCAMQYQCSSELAGVYAQHGIRTIVLKGIAAGSNYPNPSHRPCGDLDCFLMGDYEKGNIVAEKIGAHVVRDHYKHSHIKYKYLEVENHQFCTAIRGSRKMKSFERLLQSILKEGKTDTIGDTKLEAPPSLFNALFLIHHAQRHYLSEGIALRHLCDWAMFIKVRGNEVDWKYFKSLAIEYGFADFAAAMTRLCAKYLKIDMPEAYDVGCNDALDDILLEDILKYNNVDSHGGLFMQRMQIVKTVIRNRYRYKLFSDRTMVGNLATLLGGYLFDRNPSI